MDPLFVKNNYMNIYFKKFGSFLVNIRQAGSILGLSVKQLRDLKSVGLGPTFYKKPSADSNHIYYALDHLYDYSLGLPNEFDKQKRKQMFQNLYFENRTAMLLKKKESAQLLSISVTTLDRHRENIICEEDHRSQKGPVLFHIHDILSYIVELEYRYTQ